MTEHSDIDHVSGRSTTGHEWDGIKELNTPLPRWWLITFYATIVWAIGYHWMKINPAVLMGGVAGARSHSGPAREAAKEIGSSVPWIGFPVGYAISGVLLTVFGYLAMVMSQ